MDTNRIKEIHQKTAFPNSISVQQALLQVWNECEQQHIQERDRLRSENERLKNLVVALSRYHGDMEKLRDRLILEWPKVQGFRNRYALDKIAMKSCDRKLAGEALEALEKGGE